MALFNIEWNEILNTITGKAKVIVAYFITLYHYWQTE